MKHLDKRQHGFRPKHSTITRIIEHCGKILRYLDAKEFPLSIYLDIAKALDIINHKAILWKLIRFGFEKQFLKFFADSFSNGTQFVCFKDKFKSELTATSGSP